MFDYIAMLEKNRNGVMATQNGSKVATRVFYYLFAVGGKVYFSTGSQKQVYDQLQANPYVSFCTYTPDFAPVMSLNGKAIFVDDRELKTRALDENPSIKAIYERPDNPVFQIFYIDVEDVQIFTFTEGPKTYKA